LRHLGPLDPADARRHQGTGPAPDVVDGVTAKHRQYQRPWCGPPTMLRRSPCPARAALTATPKTKAAARVPRLCLSRTECRRPAQAARRAMSDDDCSLAAGME